MVDRTFSVHAKPLHRVIPSEVEGSTGAAVSQRRQKTLHRVITSEVEGSPLFASDSHREIYWRQSGCALVSPRAEPVLSAVEGLGRDDKGKGWRPPRDKALSRRSSEGTVTRTPSFSLRRPVLAAVVCVLLVLGGVGTVQAQDDAFDTSTRNVTKRGTTSADFLAIPIGARATAMGNAVTALVGDATSIYWNPSGLAQMTDVGFAGEYAEWLVEIDFNFVAIVAPTRWGTFGLGITSMRVPEMEVTTVELQDGTGETFTAGSYALALSYGRALTDRFALGGSVKLINERIWNSSATGVAFDVGTQFVTPFRGIRLGAAISNFGTKLQLGGDDLLTRVDIDPNNGGNNESNRALLRTDRFDMPLTMRIGLAGEVFESAGSRLTLAVEAVNPNNSEQYVNLGAEVGLLNGLVLFRGGYSELLLDDSLRSFTLGAGLHYRFAPLDFTVDYAFEKNEFFSDVNRFTFSVQF